MNYILFTTTRCPKCPAFKEFVKTHVLFEGTLLDETCPNFLEQTQTHKISSAPTIIIFDTENKELFKGNEIYELEEFLKNANRRN